MTYLIAIKCEVKVFNLFILSHILFGNYIFIVLKNQIIILNIVMYIETSAKKLQFSSGCNFEMTSLNQDMALKLLRNFINLVFIKTRKHWNFWAALKPYSDLMMSFKNFIRMRVVIQINIKTKTRSRDRIHDNFGRPWDF